MMSVSQIRQNYHEESAADINKQINLELYAFYTYRSLVSQISVLRSVLSQQLSDMLKLECDILLRTSCPYSL